MTAPNWTRAEDAILEQDWPAGVPTEDILTKLPGRGVASITSRAHRIGLKRPGWYHLEIRKRGAEASAMRRDGRILWSDTATKRLVRLANEHGPSGAARIMRVTRKQAEGRLHRIGWRMNKPKEPAPTEVETYQPVIPGADRVAALVDRARSMGVAV